MATFKTDGYIAQSADPNGQWRYASASESKGDTTNPLADAWIRIERSTDSLPGTQVKYDGTVASGPVVKFSNIDELLTANPDEFRTSFLSRKQAQQKLYIQWAGIHPHNLKVIYIVWAVDIVINRVD